MRNFYFEEIRVKELISDQIATSPICTHTGEVVYSFEKPKRMDNYNLANF